MSNNKNDSETTITIYGDKSECYVMTSDSAYIEVLDRLCIEDPENYKLENVGICNEAVIDKEYVVKDKSLIRFFRK